MSAAPSPSKSPSAETPGIETAGHWFTVKVRLMPPPENSIVPVRMTPLFEATLKEVAPLPVPAFPDVTVIHGAEAVAVHATLAETAIVWPAASAQE